MKHAETIILALALLWVAFMIVVTLAAFLYDAVAFYLDLPTVTAYLRELCRRDPRVPVVYFGLNALLLLHLYWPWKWPFGD